MQLVRAWFSNLQAVSLLTPENRVLFCLHLVSSILFIAAPPPSFASAKDRPVHSVTFGQHLH
jgi:hypothetical protein